MEEQTSDPMDYRDGNPDVSEHQKQLMDLDCDDSPSSSSARPYQTTVEDYFSDEDSDEDDLSQGTRFVCNQVFALHHSTFLSCKKVQTDGRT
jgi:hypothetical protein